MVSRRNVNRVLSHFCGTVKPGIFHPAKVYLRPLGRNVWIAPGFYHFGSPKIDNGPPMAVPVLKEPARGKIGPVRILAVVLIDVVGAPLCASFTPNSRVRRRPVKIRVCPSRKPLATTIIIAKGYAPVAIIANPIWRKVGAVIVPAFVVLARNNPHIGAGSVCPKGRCHVTAKTEDKKNY